ncbi:hypothetical protein GS455_22250 [Rhodococcus hoagii]|nr:hypothetical protein [Prescottella equi]
MNAFVSFDRLMLRRRVADLVGSYEPGRAKHTGSLRDPMAAARKRRRAEERQRIEDEKAERRAAARNATHLDANRNGGTPRA